MPIYLIDNSEQVTPTNYEGLLTGYESNDSGLDIHYINGHGNIGYGRAHNLILNSLNSDFHLILNSDVIIDKESLLNAISVMNHDADVIGISPHAENMLGEKQYLCKRYPSVFTLFIRGFSPETLKVNFSERLFSYEMRELSENKDSKGIELISGCFMLVETKVLKLVDGFDESYFLYFEDFDLSIRLRKYGKLAYAPKVRIRHAGGRAANKGTSHIVEFIRSGYRFFNAHGWRFF